VQPVFLIDCALTLARVFLDDQASACDTRLAVRALWSVSLTLPLHNGSGIEMFVMRPGLELPWAVGLFIAFLVIVVLIGVTAWLVRRSGANRLSGSDGGRPRQRLAVIDAARVDKNRKLVLVRRDNIEHLLVIGGPTDVVIEPNIVRVLGAPQRVRSVAPAPNSPAELSDGKVTLGAVPAEQAPISPLQSGRLSELAHQLNDALRSSAAVEQPLKPPTKVAPVEAVGSLEDDLADLLSRPR
jgi:flagellar biogenesis protein FliO